ncbi:MAG: hypothetical protein HS116_12300 [Planctomycetes bacterium]|nr:hypothetical protein [Planctomycetota bacterium]
MATLEITLTDDVDGPAFGDGTLALTPRFYGNGRESVPCALLTVKNCDGAVASRFLLVVNGRNLSLELVDRTRPVLSTVDRLEAEMAKDAVPA